ncbi:MAG: outer membrane protein assembly factor BamE [Caulobacteraceae bacterium]|nr:outer membrane protein assembly factor BamE [Caulobacter sp.]
MRRPALLASAAVALACASACAPVTSFNGYQAQETKPQNMKVGVDTKSTVLAQLGSPSEKATFDPNTWYYVSQITDEYAYYKPQVRTRDVVRISFAPDEKVAAVDHMTLKDGFRIAYNPHETPTRGRSLSWVEQVLGTIGAAGALPQDNDPGNPRGGR